MEIEKWLNTHKLNQHADVSTWKEHGIESINDFDLFETKDDIDNFIKNDLKVKSTLVQRKIKKKILAEIDLDSHVNNKNKPKIKMTGSSQNKFDATNQPNPHQSLMYEADKNKTVAKLTVEEKKRLITKFNLFCGRFIDRKTGKITVGELPIFKLKPSNDFLTNFKEENYFKSDTKIAHCSNFAELARSGYSNYAVQASGGLNLGIFKIGGSAKYHENTSKSSHKINKAETLSYIAEGLHSRGKLILGSSCLSLSEKFANDMKHLSNEKLKERYGDFVVLSVTFGGKIYSTKCEKNIENTNIQNKKEEFGKEFKLAVEYKKVSIGGGYKDAKGNEEKRQVSNTSMNINMRLEAVGGDVCCASADNWTEWTKSIIYDNWAIINVDSIKDITKLNNFQVYKKSIGSKISQFAESFIQGDAKEIDEEKLKLKLINEQKKHLNVKAKLKDLEKHNINDNAYKYKDIHNASDLDFKTTELTQDHKLNLLKKFELFYGKKLNERNRVTCSSYKVFQKKDLDEIRFTELNSRYQNTVITSNKMQKQLAQDGYACSDKHFGTNLGVSYYGKKLASAGVNYSDEKNESTENSNYGLEEEHSIISHYDYRKYKIVLNADCVKVTERFAKDYLKLVRKKLNLYQFHDRYGYWVNLQTSVGGKIFSSKVTKISKDEDKSAKKSEHQQAFSAALNTCIGLNVDGGFANASGNQNIKGNANQSMAQAITLEVSGGDVDLFDTKNSKKWLRSLNEKPLKWNPIEIGVTKNIFDLIEWIEEDYPEIYEQIEAEFNHTTNANNLNMKSFYNRRKIFFFKPERDCLNILFIGPKGVGKKSLMNKYCYNKFSNQKDTCRKMYQYTEDVTINTHSVMSMNEMRSMINIHIIVVCYDRNIDRTFNDCGKYVEDINECKEVYNPRLVVVLAGCKSDKNPQMEQDTKKQDQLSLKKENEAKWKNLDAMDCVCSAKTGYNISSLFHTAVTMYTQQYSEGK